MATTAQPLAAVTSYMEELARTRPQREATRRQAWQTIPRYWSATLGRYVTIPED